MSLLKRAFNRADSHNFIGARSLGTWNPSTSMFSHLHSDAFASAYPSIRAIADEYKTVMPFAIDANGKRVEQNEIINALYHPNQSDSSVAFFEKIVISTLVLPKTYILVWRRDGLKAEPGGDFRVDKIAGFTFLEFPAVTRRDGRTFYSIGSQEFSDREVIVLPGGVNPHDLYGGYSPSEAARRWAKLDDYIADYQAGFFENGAVPAGQFMITAPTAKEYNDIVDTLQDRHRGAGKNGNVTYSHRPVDLNTGKPAEAQIEWIPFSQSNKDIDFKSLFQQVNQRIDVAYGVPAIIKGIDSTATYSNAQVADKTFSKRAVYPRLLGNYTQINHELNRITGGTGIAITFKYDIPSVDDEEKVKAETKQTEAGIITTMVKEGYSLDSIVEAFKLSNSYKLLKTGNGQAVINNDKPDVDEGGEVDSSPDPEKIDGVTPINQGGSKRKNPKAELTDLQKLEAATRKFMQTQIDKAVNSLGDTPKNTVDEEEDEQETFVDEMLVTIVAVMIAKGEIQYTAGASLLEEAGISIETLNGFNLSDAAQADYRTYLTRVGESYGQDTSASIRKVLLEAEEKGYTRKQTEEALKNIMNTDEYRVTRLATTELNRSQSLGGLESMKQIEAETGATIEKSLSHEGSSTTPCEFCQSQEGVWKAVTQPLVGLGETVEGTDGGIYINDFVAIEAGDLHPHGNGTTIYRVVR